jgi:hypothetical protein
VQVLTKDWSPDFSATVRKCLFKEERDRLDMMKPREAVVLDEMETTIDGIWSDNP